MPALKIWNDIDNTWEYVKNSSYDMVLYHKTASYGITTSYCKTIENQFVTCSYVVSTSYAMSGSPTYYPIAINQIIDGYNNALITGSHYYVQMPFAAKITGWTILADDGGSCVVDIRKCDYASFPPSASHKISDGDSPTLGGPLTYKNRNTNITSWTTTTFNEGDIIEFYLSSSSYGTISRITVALIGYRI